MCLNELSRILDNDIENIINLHKEEGIPLADDKDNGNSEESNNEDLDDKEDITSSKGLH